MRSSRPKVNRLARDTEAPCGVDSERGRHRIAEPLVIHIRRRLAPLLVVLTLTTPLGTAAARAEISPRTPDAAVAREIEGLVRDRSDASARGDVARWKRRIADDCAWIGVGLAVQTTASVAEAQIGFVGRNEVEDFTARVHGEVVVATYLLVQHVGEGANARIVRLRKLDTYHRRNGEWWLVANAESLAPPPRTVVAVDPARLDRLAGEYAGAFARKPVNVRVWRNGKALMAQDSTSPNPFELRPTSDTSFFVDDEPADWLFELDAEGPARALIYRAGGVDLRFERVGTATPAEDRPAATK